MQEADARRNEALADLRAIMGQLKVFRKVQEEARTWREEADRAEKQASVAPTGIARSKTANARAGPRWLTQTVDAVDWRSPMRGGRRGGDSHVKARRQHRGKHSRNGRDHRADRRNHIGEQQASHGAGAAQGVMRAQQQHHHEEDEDADTDADDNSGEDGGREEDDDVIADDDDLGSEEEEERRYQLEETIQDLRAANEDAKADLDEAEDDLQDALLDHREHKSRIDALLTESIDERYNMFVQGTEAEHLADAGLR
jgi:hypothetical protein